MNADFSFLVSVNQRFHLHLAQVQVSASQFANPNSRYLERLTKFLAKLLSSRSPGHLLHSQNCVGLGVEPENYGEEYLGNPGLAA